MPVSSFLPTTRRISAAWAVLIAIALLLFSAAAAVPHVVRLEPVPNATMPNGTLEVAGDTLHSSPWVADTLAAWNPAQPRMFCITSFAEWPGYLYLRVMHDGGSTACEGAALGLMQAPTCPTPEQLNEIPPFILVQCGPAVFRRNKNGPATSNPLPVIPGVRIV